MNIMFKAEIDSYTYAGEKKISCKKIISAEKPGELLEAMKFTEGTKVKLPETEDLLYHLFERGCAYCSNNYVITVTIL